jgi:Cd2+/Zn2+-exporting ATPase
LVSIAVLGAVGIGEFLEAASLVFLFSIAEILEDYAADRARSSLKKLMELAPNEARVRRDGKEELLPVEELKIGDLILVRPGERISMDGVVEAGSSTVNQAPITGESLPVSKERGDLVFAGTINIDGFLEIRVTKLAQDNTLAKIIRLVEEAEAEKAPAEQFVKRFARYYTPAVVRVALAVAAIPPLLFAQGFTGWFLKAITLLVIACPCTLVISTPVSVISAITNAARNGVLVKGGVHLENMGQARIVAFDKTGTLTLGQPQVTDLIPLNDHSKEDLLRIAAAVERRSEHPLAEAIVRAAEELQLELEDVEDFRALAGHGVRAKLNGQVYHVGRPALFALSLSPSQLKLGEVQINKLQEEGKTAVLVGSETGLCGVIALADRPRPGAREVIARLQELGLEVVMLTGDNERTAKAIAKELGIAHFRAGLLPEEKVEEIKNLQKYGTVAMVGDGVNDAPALAQATVGIAMGAAGTDVALETADIALMADDLTKLPYLVKLSRKARLVIRENIWASILIKFSLGAGVFPGLVTLALAVLIGDMGATLGVTANALRLARVKR